VTVGVVDVDTRHRWCVYANRHDVTKAVALVVSSTGGEDRRSRLVELLHVVLGRVVEEGELWEFAEWLLARRDAGKAVLEDLQRMRGEADAYAPAPVYAGYAVPTIHGFVPRPRGRASSSRRRGNAARSSGDREPDPPARRPELEAAA
jgi:hypothetical protein